MRNRKTSLILLLIASISVAGAHVCLAQTAALSLTRILPDTFDDADLSSLQNGESLVKVLPTARKSEVAICGLLGSQAPAQVFLDSFHENMLRRSNSAILEIGAFSKTPTLDDLKGLTLDDRDIEDLKQCVIGDCKLKLSATMISRFQKEIDWNAPDYKSRADQLFKQMLVEYVADYLARGDSVLINYHDKSEPVGVAEGYRELLKASRYNELTNLQTISGRSRLELVENAVVWSKIEFGLKPVININQISLFRNAESPLSEVLIVSKQIYANHYFEASLGLTAYFKPLEPTSPSYLFYENRSRLDGLEGPFGKIKRGLIEERGLASLRSILNQSHVTFNARAASAPDNTVERFSMQSLGSLKFRKWHLVAVPLWLVFVFLITRLRTRAVKDVLRKGRIET